MAAEHGEYYRPAWVTESQWREHHLREPEGFRIYYGEFF